MQAIPCNGSPLISREDSTADFEGHAIQERNFRERMESVGVTEEDIISFTAARIHFIQSQHERN